MTEKLTKEKAAALIESWADIVELDTDRDMYQDILEELRLPVRLQKLTFDMEEEIFKLQLNKPISGPNGEIHIVEIKSIKFEAKRVLQKYKQNEGMDSARALIKAYTGLEESSIKQLKDRDFDRINCIIIGFFMQVDSKKR